MKKVKKIRNLLALFMVVVLSTTSNAINIAAETEDNHSTDAAIVAYDVDTSDTDTYNTDTAAETTTTSPVLKYFPVTLYDYDADTINAATDDLDTDLTVREGIYFSGGDPEATWESSNVDVGYRVEDGSVVIEDGTYALYCVDTSYYVTNDVNTNSDWGTTVLNGTTANDSNSATQWTFTRQDDGTYTIQDSTGAFLEITGRNSATMTADKNTVSISVESAADYTFAIYDDAGEENGYMNSLGKTDYGIGYFGGYSEGSTFKIQKVGEMKLTAGYEEWNRWDKASGDNANGQKMYTGLVESTLDANKNIVFTKPEGGIFNSDSSVKSIYTNVEVPFVLENGFYTMDASQNAVYFHQDDTQGSSGTAGSNTRLYFFEATTQSNGGTYGDGSSTVWAPYNDSIDFSESDMNYHFGMQATVPFTMNANGRTDGTDDTSDAIQFSFSGDDDVWIFIDGKLVVDLGGIHNRLDATIDFAANTVTYSANNSAGEDTDGDGTKEIYATGSYNDDEFELTQTLFGGLISQDRESFSASGSHELTIYYLERGKGSSNCQIKFNLPVNDTVTVTKDATQSWSAATNVVSLLTTEEQAVVDNIDFGFTLYKSTDGGTTYEKVANENYYLLNANGQVLSTPSTDANGHFTLKNGQSARFITTSMDDENGATYYVVEDAVAGFTEPDYNYNGEADGGFKVLAKNQTYTTYTSASLIPELECFDGDMTSDKITVYGNETKDDSLVFICSNFLDAELPNPSARPVDDKIVIDYGLPVEIDVLANDVFRGNKIELVSATGDGVEINSETGVVTTEGNEPVYGTVEIKDGKLTYKLNKQLSGVEKINYVVKVTGSKTNEATGTTVEAYEYAVATVYIIPATSIYYEENFSNLVTFTEAWDNEGTAETDNQEPGVVGTVGDSPYGSDAAYINDSGDSNGSSKYVSTANGSAEFQYTFTGWGTSFFARTTNNTGTMRITITDAANKTIYTAYRSTIYKNTGTLYNIPVFTYNADEYGTYTVKVTIAKGHSVGDRLVFGSDFWLDGIKVIEPLNLTDNNVTIATSAYAADAEANMSVVTLREKLLADVTTYNDDGEFVWSVDDQQEGNFVLFTDINGAILSASEYESYGPKEEVYLNSGQKVSFSLAGWDADSNKIYLGMKAPTGSATVSINGTTITLTNAADCYYDITEYARITSVDENVENSDGTTTTVTTKVATFEIQSAEGSLVSVTNIKVTGNTKFALVSGNVDVNLNSNEGSDEDETEGE